MNKEVLERKSFRAMKKILDQFNDQEWLGSQTAEDLAKAYIIMSADLDILDQLVDLTAFAEAAEAAEAA